MPRPLKTLLRYLPHSSGQGRCLWTDPTGKRLERLLPGAFNCLESLQAFARLQLELSSSAEKPQDSPDGPTVVEVLAPYLRFAEGYYGPCAGLEATNAGVKVVRELYAPGRRVRAEEFGRRPGSIHPKGFWSRPYINSQIGKLIRALKWAVAEELAPAGVYQALITLSPLRRGHTAPPNPNPVNRRTPNTSPRRSRIFRPTSARLSSYSGIRGCARPKCAK